MIIKTSERLVLIIKGTLIVIDESQGMTLAQLRGHLLEARAIFETLLPVLFLKKIQYHYLSDCFLYIY